MSEDEKLLMLAAKAEGREPPIDANGVFGAWVGSAESGHWWNPLEDDGDALRLAVLLNFHVQIDFNEDPAAVYIYGGWMGEGIEESIEECRYKAVRRAITRAAAEIGKATA